MNVNNSTITANSAADGGGIFAADFAFVNLTGTTVSHNTAEFGGGIFARVRVSERDELVGDEQHSLRPGGGIYLEFSNSSLTGTHVAGNRAGDFGGGIANFDGSGIQEDVGVNPGAAAAKTGGKWARPNVAALPSVAAGKAVARPQQALLPAEGLTLTGSTVDHNTALGEGAGGIFNGAEEFDSPMSLISSTVAFNNAGATGAFGGGIVNVAFGDLTGTATITGTALRGNLARAGGGGGIYNLGEEGGTALVSLESSSVSPATSYLNGNQAEFGGGIYNDGSFGGASSVSVQPHASIIHNQASVTGGGIYNLCDADLLLAPGAVLMLNSPNNLFNAPCII